MFNPVDTLQFIMNVFQHQADLLNVDLSYHIVVGPAAVEFPDELLGDQIRLQQILVNLVKNALKFSCAKPIRILASYDQKDKLLTVQVTD